MGTWGKLEVPVVHRCDYDPAEAGPLGHPGGAKAWPGAADK